MTKGTRPIATPRGLFSLYHACSPLPGATKGNTLQAARVKLRGGVSKTTVEACDLERSHAEAIRFGPRRNARHHASTFSAMAVRPRPLANSVLEILQTSRLHGRRDPRPRVNRSDRTPTQFKRLSWNPSNPHLNHRARSGEIAAEVRSRPVGAVPGSRQPADTQVFPSHRRGRRGWCCRLDRAATPRTSHRSTNRDASDTMPLNVRPPPAPPRAPAPTPHKNPMEIQGTAATSTSPMISAAR